jgi:hypothetical protein
MDRDYWGFKNEKDLIRETKNMADTILKEQFELIYDKTNGVIYGRPMFINVNTAKVAYKLATAFDIVVPNLDNYTKTLLILYTNPETEYPLAISIDKTYADDMEDFSPEYTCNNFDQFDKAIREILSSERVSEIIKILYSKATALSRSDEY